MTEREMTLLIQTLLHFVKDIHDGKPAPNVAGIQLLLRINERDLNENSLRS